MRKRSLEIISRLELMKNGDDLATEDCLSGELAGDEFGDRRLASRFRELVGQLSRDLGASIPLSCQDWANTKAAYRFLSNEAVNEHQILSGHFKATRERFERTNEPVLILHDTTEFSFKRRDVPSIGLLNKLPGREIPTCGILMHSSLVVTSSGLPLGLGAIKFWTRDHFKGTNALKRKINPTRIPIEQKESVRWLENIKHSTSLLNDAERCVHIGDRESDIYELFYTAHQLGTRFLVRTCVDRLAGSDGSVVSKELSKEPVKGLYRLLLRDKDGKDREAVLEVKYATLRFHPPVNKRKHYSELTLTVVEAKERDAPTGKERIVWKLLSNLPVKSLPQAIEKLQWYAMRWKIETFHKILKSGCRAEESRLRTAQRLTNLIAIFCIIGWRVFWITMLKRTAPSASPSLAFTVLETEILHRLGKEKQQDSTRKQSVLGNLILQVAKLGGYLAPANDPPPGNIVIWRGMSRLSDIQFGFCLQQQRCG